MVEERALVPISRSAKGAIELLKQLSPEERALLKNTVAKGATDDELALFMSVAQSRGLNPFNRQIHFVKRRQKDENDEWREVGTSQTGIDGFRLIAERTGHYAPSPKPTLFEYDKDGKLKSATVWGIKIIGNQAFEFSASAIYTEYVQRKKDGNPTRFWKEMPHSQLEKCAEAKMLRKGFPEELSGLYTHEEMGQADNIEVIEAKYITPKIEETAMLTPAEIEHDWLKTCPEHNAVWAVNKFGRLQHWTNDKDEAGKTIYCKAGKVFWSFFTQQAIRAGFQEGEKYKLDEWLKPKFGATWSKLTEEAMLEAIQLMEQDANAPGQEVIREGEAE